jgi:hypothetical protein
MSADLPRAVSRPPLPLPQKVSSPARVAPVRPLCPRALPIYAICLALWAAAFLTLTPGPLRAAPPILPDPKLTPGATLPVTRDDICVPGYSRKVRNVPAAVKRQAYAEYGIRHHLPGEYEVDHLISLELGGSNSIKNLWPQSYRTRPWNARVKDQLENKLHELVCSGQLDLKTAQHDIAADWIAAYKNYFHTDRPLSMRRSRRGGRSGTGHRRSSARPRRSQGAAPAAPSGGGVGVAAGETRVWVNTDSGKYFRPGTRYYGKTKEGKYMSESEAIRQGYTAAKGQ